MITYHENLPIVPSNHFTINHNHLSKEIQQFIEDKNVKQYDYFVASNAFYMFIYLKNHARIDVAR